MRFHAREGQPGCSHEACQSSHSNRTEMNSEFESIFARLRAILEPYSARLKVTADTPEGYCLELAYSPKLKKAFPAAWVKTGKGYVSYHFMPVYMFPKLREGMSDKLQA